MSRSSEAAGAHALTREALLALRPTELIPAALRGGLSSEDWGTASLVFAYHLKAAAVPIEALELCLAGLAAAADEAATSPNAALQRVARVLAIHVADQPALAPWMEQIAAEIDPIEPAARLANAVRLIEHARRTWLLLEIGELA